MSGPDIFELTDNGEPQEEPKEEVALVELTDQSNPLVVEAANAGLSVQENQVAILDKFMQRAEHGHQAFMPMDCKGSACPFLGMCPLYEAKIELPLNQPCPVEKSVIARWVQKTIEAIGIEDPNDPEFAVDIDMIHELAGFELLRMRAAHHLAKSPALVQEKIIAYSPQGDPVYDEKPAMSLLILERYAKVVAKLRSELLATRKAQAQVGRVAGDISQRGANIKKRAQEILERRMKGEKIADAEFAEVDAESKEDGESNSP